MNEVGVEVGCILLLLLLLQLRLVRLLLLFLLPRLPLWLLLLPFDTQSSADSWRLRNRARLLILALARRANGEGQVVLLRLVAAPRVLILRLLVFLHFLHLLLYDLIIRQKLLVLQYENKKRVI